LDTIHSKPKILIVDDHQDNIDILTAILEDTYELSIAMNGSSALQIVPQFMPDLILLDIMMPVMNGFEFLKRIKKNPAYSNIYIMILTSNSGSEELIKALDLGANHYLTKPYRPIEVHAWIKTLIRMKKAEDQLKHSISILEHNAALGIQTASFAHDLGNILNNFLSYQVIEYDLNDIEKKLDQVSNKKIKNNIDRIRDSCFDIKESLSLGEEICSTIMSYSRSYHSQKKLWDLKEIVKIPLGIYKRQFLNNNIDLMIDFQNTSPILCRNCEIQRILLNLISNALEAMKNVQKKELTIKIYEIDKWVVLSMKDTGHGISTQNQSKIFNRFFSTKKIGSGIGLDIVKRIVESHRGKISFESKENVGTTFKLLFPIPSG